MTTPRPNEQLDEHVTNLAFFLLDRCGSVCGKWVGRLPAATQRSLFGRFLGKGTIIIDGARETIEHSRKVCFGLDFDVNHRLSWRDL